MWIFLLIILIILVKIGERIESRPDRRNEGNWLSLRERRIERDEDKLGLGPRHRRPLVKPYLRSQKELDRIDKALTARELAIEHRKLDLRA